MKIAYFQNSSLMDFPNHISPIIFTFGCNLRCGFCHNKELVLPENNNKIDEIDFNKILEYIKKNLKMINGVTFTGGEPLLNNDLIEYIKPLKALNLDIKLDTNGSLPIQLKKIIDSNMIDYIAMDLKSDSNNYKKICGIDLYNKQLESIEIFEKSNIKGEYRLTCFSDDIKFYKKIFNLIKSTKKTLYLQQFLNKETLDPDFKKIPNTSLKLLNELKEIANSYNINTEIRKYF
ncbi:MAG: anaerobic ribonucleoside-triphosphate reductase activating protein [Candidatus Nanoarchaeia archaeon]|nr:anaerobic ribonucleoside-triphosphate reductase activating protein [Candidatus Nanoarchaeia archaeon]